MNNLIVSVVKYRWYTFTASPRVIVPWEKFWFFSLKEFDWYHVETKKNITKYAFRHGSKVWWTSNWVRTFNMTFSAYASDEIERLKLIRLVSSIFNPPSIMSDTDWFHPLEMMMPDWTWWTVEAEVTTRPKVFDYNNDKWCTFQVELVAKENSFMYSKDAITIHDVNTRHWIRLATALPKHRLYYRDKIEYSWTNDAPVNVTMTIRDAITLPRIYVRTCSWEKIITTLNLPEMEFNAWDVIKIDSLNETVSLTTWWITTDITAQISLNSEFPRVLSPLEDEWSIVVVDCWYPEPVMDVVYEFYSIWD